MIPVYIELNAQQAYDVVHGADSIGLEVLPNIKPGSVLWLSEPWRISHDPMGCGLSNSCYEYQAEQLDNRNWRDHVGELVGWSDGWRDAAIMPSSAIRLRRRCTLVKEVKRVGFNRHTQNSHFWHIGIGPLEEEEDDE